MGIEYICDTNTVIYFLQQQFPPSSEKFMDDLFLNQQPIISAITEIELLCWKTTNEKDLAAVHNFIDITKVIELEQPIKLKTAEIRKQHKVKLPDAIISATALIYDLTLITHNVGDFKNIRGLKVVDPFNA
ncbi:type II toxin-antitoxin system VapC family toxin [Mucilaginibacter sp.]|uniref:type II toxin-antitoxin system VapC family toxin n=1 Tax=Mucilaginibacter sp. TaxID=1882438 RepID=UPI003AFFE3D3